mgnify:CR=1 FL=1
MPLRNYLSILVLFIALLSCSRSALVQEDSGSVSSEPDEYINMNINEAVYFRFEKHDTLWTGDLTVYTLNTDGEKVIQSRYESARDSTWEDFSNFVSFLDIYTLPQQYEIEGWAPNSSQLPKRVYSFTVFNGDSVRAYSYQDPINNIRDNWQAQNVRTFSTFIQNELHWVRADTTGR